LAFGIRSSLRESPAHRIESTLLENFEGAGCNKRIPAIREAKRRGKSDFRFAVGE
jgi:hypothetical protein